MAASDAGSFLQRIKVRCRPKAKAGRLLCLVYSCESLHRLLSRSRGLGVARAQIDPLSIIFIAPAFWPFGMGCEAVV
jgi:hypothetical protein